MGALAKVFKIYVPIPGKYNEKKNKLRKNWQLHDKRFKIFEIGKKDLHPYKDYDGCMNNGRDVGMFYLPEALQKDGDDQLLDPIANFTAEDFRYDGDEISSVCGFPFEDKEKSFELWTHEDDKFFSRKVLQDTGLEVVQYRLRTSGGQSGGALEVWEDSNTSKMIGVHCAS